MPVTYIAYTDAADQVDVFFTGCIIQPGPFGPADLEGKGRFGCLRYMQQKKAVGWS